MQNLKSYTLVLCTILITSCIVVSRRVKSESYVRHNLIFGQDCTRVSSLWSPIPPDDSSHVRKDSAWRQLLYGAEKCAIHENLVIVISQLHWVIIEYRSTDLVWIEKSRSFTKKNRFDKFLREQEIDFDELDFVEVESF